MTTKVREVPVRFHSTGGTFTLRARASPDGSAAAPAVESETIAVGGVAYTGAVLDSFFGGVVADLDGMQPIPERGAAILYGHIPGIGVIKAVSRTERGLEYSGHIVRGLAETDRIALLAKHDFPWQLSIRAEPEVVEEVLDGVEAEVNGFKVTGPLIIFRQWRLPEISIVELGLDGDTEATIAAHAGGGVRRRVLVASPTDGDMAEQDTATAPATVEELRASNPDLVAAIEAAAQEAGVSAERARITEILDATRAAIVAEDAKEGDEPQVEAQALDVVASAVKDGKAANTLMASLLKLSRTAAKAAMTPQDARRAITATAEQEESGQDTPAPESRANGRTRQGSLMASAKATWAALPHTEKAKWLDERAFVGEQLRAAAAGGRN